MCFMSIGSAVIQCSEMDASTYCYKTHLKINNGLLVRTGLTPVNGSGGMTISKLSESVAAVTNYYAIRKLFI